MLSKHVGLCFECGERIDVGAEIFMSKKIKRWGHNYCVPRDEREIWHYETRPPIRGGESKSQPVRVKGRRGSVGWRPPAQHD